jgi:hypothetical protein
MVPLVARPSRRHDQPHRRLPVVSGKSITSFNNCRKNFCFGKVYRTNMSHIVAICFKIKEWQNKNNKISDANVDDVN